jgi:drug/metabolite transporter (DMT)-like permease
MQNDMWQTILAIIFGMLAYSFLNIGMALQKKGASLLPNIEDVPLFQSLKSFITNKFWLIGFLFTAIQFCFYLAALNLGSLSIVAPMLGVGIVVLTIFSNFYLKEPICKMEYTGIAAIIVGVIVLGATNPLNQESFSLEFIIDSLSKVGSIIFLIVIFVITLCACIYSAFRHFHLADVIYGAAGGLSAGFSAIFTKSVMSGIDFSNVGESLNEAIGHWYWWVFLMLMLTANVFSTALPQVAFQKGKAIIVTPIFNVMALIMPIFAGIIIFNEWSTFKTWLIIVKAVSLVVIAAGVYVLSYIGTQCELQNMKKESEQKIKENEIISES